MSVLTCETLAVLRTVKAVQPLFSNQIEAELFAMRHTFGTVTVHPRTCGGYAVCDSRDPFGSGPVSVHRTEKEAHEAAKSYAAGK